MPRRHRSARERPATTQPQRRDPLAAPAWAVTQDAVVRSVAGDSGKTYRCPGCDHEIRTGVAHLVVIEGGDVEGRRHWHTACWRTELRRRGRPV